MNAAGAETIGIDIGGTKMLAVVLDAQGAVAREARRASPQAGLDALVQTAVALVGDLATDRAPIGVGAAGLVDERGDLRYAPNLPAIREADLHDALTQTTGHPVAVDNDANVAALGEITYGAATDVQHALFVTLGTGIGGGLLLDGHLYRGAHHLGGEIGHFTVDRDGPLCACGERGHWEAIASGTALGRMARDMIGRRGGAAILAAAGGEISAVNGVHVGVAAGNGDDDAKQLLVEYAENVALGLAGLANIFDPERIIIAGGLVELGGMLFGPVREAFGRHLEGVDYRPTIEIMPAQLGERAGAVGAAVLARQLLT
jgi:glucokinase